MRKFLDSTEVISAEKNRQTEHLKIPRGTHDATRPQDAAPPFGDSAQTPKGH